MTVTGTYLFPTQTAYLVAPKHISGTVSKEEDYLE